MISRVLRKFHFSFLKVKVKTFGQFKKLKPFDQLSSKMIEQNIEMLRPYYEQYIKEVSRADMAASLELAAFIYSVCKINRYTKLLDMGSGLSSFVFRLYAKENLGVTVFSVDDDAAWLEKTKDFLLQHQLITDNIFTLDQFLKSGEKEFDCILHDLNFVEIRIKYIEHIMRISKRNGLVIFDDVHKPDYLFALLIKLKNMKAKKYNIRPLTYDVYGRFSLAATKEE